MIPDKVPTSSSIGFVTSSVTSSGLAPGYTVLMIIMGMFISGVSSILEDRTEESPNTNRHRIHSTVVTGRLRTYFVKFIMVLSSLYCFPASVPASGAVSPVLPTGSASFTSEPS